MKIKRQVKIFIAILLIMTTICTSALAAEYSNAYISSGSAYIHKWGDGDISVEFSVVGTYIMDEIGAHRITVYKMLGGKPNAATDELIVSYWYTDNPWMMGSDDVLFSGSVRLSVESGEYYYATLSFYASLDGDGDKMLYCTDITKA